ncbi:MAG: DUF2306 domain-containing protein [Crocinitomicaceae bacterium]|nr:DUF2306 domain-containing protein [Crocinitomicaceae bacterium]
MLLITLQYIPLRFDVAFLHIKTDEIQHTYYQVAFFTHVYTSMFVLISGALQFIPGLRKQFPKFHRSVGYVYILVLLLFSGPSGIIMGIKANGGIYSQISFTLLGILWMIFTAKALIAIKNGNWELHQKFMLRSYALTLSAISLRLIKQFLANTYSLPPMDMYKIVAWAGWVLNLVIVEIYIFYHFRLKKS